MIFNQMGDFQGRLIMDYPWSIWRRLYGGYAKIVQLMRDKVVKFSEIGSIFCSEFHQRRLRLVLSSPFLQPKRSKIPKCTTGKYKANRLKSIESIRQDGV